MGLAAQDPDYEEGAEAEDCTYIDNGIYTFPGNRSNHQSKIHVRLAGIDAPEMAHFGRPAQPFSKDAHTWLTDFVLGRRARAHVLRHDQYKRVVATVYIRRWLFFRRDVGLQMLRNGWATVYEAKTGAEYGGDKLERKYRDAEALAKKKGRGLWKGLKGRKAAASWESPRDYKNRMKELESGNGTGAGNTSTTKK